MSVRPPIMDARSHPKGNACTTKSCPRTKLPCGRSPPTCNSTGRCSSSWISRTMPHTLRAVDRNSEVLSALKVLSGFDEDLACESTRAINRLRSLLVQIYPSLERVFPGVVLARAIVLDLLIRYHGLAGLKAAGKNRSETVGTSPQPQRPRPAHRPGLRNTVRADRHSARC